MFEPWRDAGCIPQPLVYMIQTGESSGKLDVMLGTMAEYYDREEEMNGKVRAAMTYPVILLGVTIVSSVFMLTTVLPQFASMMKEQELPLLTRVLMSASLGLRNHGDAVSVAAIGFICPVHGSSYDSSGPVKS